VVEKFVFDVERGLSRDGITRSRTCATGFAVFGGAAASRVSTIERSTDTQTNSTLLQSTLHADFPLFLARTDV
jgi:hypothetical protein